MRIENGTWIAVAWLAFVVSTKPASCEAAAFIQTEPTARLSSVPAATDLSLLGPDDYARFYGFPSPLVAGLELYDSGVELVFRIDVRPDLASFVRGDYRTNLPFLPGGLAAIEDVNMPSVAYLQYESSRLRASAGRRQLKWGPGTYGLAISNSAPYLDNLSFEYRFAAGDGDAFFSYCLIGTDRAGETAQASAEANRKTVVAHRLGYESGFLRLGLGELNLLYGVVPDLPDLSPLVAFHNLYQDSYSNVMLEASAELATEVFRAFGEFVLDDLVMPWEDSSYHPTALGWSWGLEWRPSPGDAYGAPRSTEADYGLREADLRRPGGLTLAFERYRTTTYLYNRGSAAGKWVLPDHRLVDDYDLGGYLDSDYAFYLGFPYGADCSLERVAARFESRRLRAELYLERLRRGAYGVRDEYSSASNVHDWLELVGPVERTATLGISASWLVHDSGGVSLSLEAGGRAAFGGEGSARIGCRIKLGANKRRERR